MGANIPFETLPQVADKGRVLLAAKVLLGATAALLVGHLLGTSRFRPACWGLSTLAVVAAINDTMAGFWPSPGRRCEAPFCLSCSHPCRHRGQKNSANT